MTTYPDLGAPAGPGAPAAAAATHSNRVDWATVPRVNLLPDEILQGRRTAGLKRVLAGAVVLVVVLCGAGVAWAQSGVSAAQADLDAAQARGAQLHAQQAKYAAVPTVLGLIDGVQAAREQAMGRDVLWYGLLSDLALTTPKGVKLDSLNVSLDGDVAAAPSTSTGTGTGTGTGATGGTAAATPAAGATTGGDPLTPGGIGRVDFTGEAAHFPDVATWLETVATLHGLAGSTLQTAARGTGPTGGPGGSGGSGGSGRSGGAVSFTSTVQVTPKALTHRYDRKAD